ncbi:hypothetical protein [Streptomyces sp. NPDC056817]|uniref:hypothetical protein n=1 Tax=Streptomyces sp. NPDC056817 TaxID=3345950 RepID=UPI0036B363B5
MHGGSGRGARRPSERPTRLRRCPLQPQRGEQTQHAWNTTYDALAAPHRRDTTALRRRLLRLSVRLWWHPYWDTARSVPVARTELRQLARARD